MNTQITKDFPISLPASEYPDFSERLRFTMTLRHCSVADLAAALYVGSTTISGYRTGMRHPDLHNLRLICKTLHVSADFLLGLEDQIYF